MGLVASACIENPGPYSLTVKAGSHLELVDVGGVQYHKFDFGTPMCGDGVDNDVDGMVDLNDPDCTSASDDNERLSGAQSLTEGVQPMDIAADGTMTYDPGSMVVPQREHCIDVGGTEPWCLGVTIVGVAGERTGQFNGGAVSFPLTIEIELVALTGYPDLGNDCSFGPIDGVWVADNYDSVTGASHMVISGSAVPAATDCGPFTDAINGFLQLPSTGNGVMESTILDANGQPMRVSQ